MAAKIARKGNVRAIRPGISIPTQRQEDESCIQKARLAASFSNRAYDLAQTEPNSKAHHFALHMAGISEDLPRNNLKLIVTPLSPREEWFHEAMDRYRVACREGLCR